MPLIDDLPSSKYWHGNKKLSMAYEQSIEKSIQQKKSVLNFE